MGRIIPSSVSTMCAATSTAARPNPDHFWGQLPQWRGTGKIKCLYAKRKILDIHTIKMEDFVEAKFKYLARFEQFRWMSYLTTQYLVHENLLQVFFSNATIKSTNEQDEDLCRIVTINTFMMGVPIGSCKEWWSKLLTCQITTLVMSTRVSLWARGFPMIMLYTSHSTRESYFYLSLTSSDP